MAKLLFERQVLLIRAMMVKGPGAISEILESASLIKVQNPSRAEWSGRTGCRVFCVLITLVAQGFRSRHPTVTLLSHNQLWLQGIQVRLCAQIQSTQSVKPGQHAESQAGPAVPAPAGHCHIWLATATSGHCGWQYPLRGSTHPAGRRKAGVMKVWSPLLKLQKGYLGASWGNDGRPRDVGVGATIMIPFFF